MAITSKALPTTTAQSIFTSTGTQGDAVTTMYFCNRDTDTRTFSLWLVPSGDVAGVNNIAGDTYIIDWEKLVLSPGDTIRANSKVANAIVATVSTIGV